MNSRLPKLFHRTTNGASVTPISNGFRLTIPASSRNVYRLAQMDDTIHLPRRKFLWHPPLTLSLRARVSSESIPGTWGFGLWNDPFGLSLGFGGNPLHLPVLPNAIWFFHASPQNYLSFREDKAAQGFLAQVFDSPSFHPSLFLIGLSFLISRKKARQRLSRIVDEDSTVLRVDSTQWHTYRFEWRPKRSVFWVDDVQVLETSVSPRPPLGLAIWIDNQYAAFTPGGKISYGVLAGKEEWLEIEDVSIREK